MATPTRTFEALADPSRFRIVELLAGGERTAGQLAAEFEVSRPAVSRHLRVLREAGLITWRGEAQRRIYRLDLEPLNEAAGWLIELRQMWASRLDRLEARLDEKWGKP